MKKLLQDWLGISKMQVDHLAALESLKEHMTTETNVVVAQVGELRDHFDLDPMVPGKIDINDYRSLGGDPQLGGV